MKKLLLTTLFTFVSFAVTFGQCAMCRATVENNISSGESAVGAGLNTGIIYLMVMPYVLISSIVYLWVKKTREKKIQGFS
ncbi:hypothetical protein [Flammeovirga agarivorans]|uniref:Uncharacterized protein n=1 Tax=Flammeovirga agarivorans TaxID=2726742 RepID=A0A7X8SLB3_9BACT|nr:hypothetical protein [Flammeovirga agarivorans]NLR92336.1 hypothetical protein [Flammeovirga agarivorans]